MTIKRLSKTALVLFVSSLMYNASANSVGFDQAIYLHEGGPASINLMYDFTDFAMFGGGVDIIYDATAIEFVSYTQAPFQDAQSVASPIGSLVAPGFYSGAGIGTYNFFTGMTTAGSIGTFVFNLVGVPDGGATPCGAMLCIVPNPINPFVSLAGNLVTDELLDNGITSADIYVIPIPGAAWFMLSGLAALLGLGRKIL